MLWSGICRQPPARWFMAVFTVFHGSNGDLLCSALPCTRMGFVSLRVEVRVE
jgi:hypothetical protein